LFQINDDDEEAPLAAPIMLLRTASAATSSRGGIMLKRFPALALAAAVAVAVSAIAPRAFAQAASAAATSTPRPAEVAPSAATRSSPAAANDTMSGTAAWYGSKFNGRKTASGQRFNATALTAAHPSLPFGSRVKVTNTKNSRSVVVVINDRGPTSPGRIIDVSQAAAKRLGFTRSGLTDVKLEVVGQSKMRGARRS
jgi:rare lipoprotein A